MNEWKPTHLGEHASIQTGPFGSQLHAADYVEFGIPSIMPTNIGTRLEVIREGLARISESDAERLARHRVVAGDIVYSRRGDVERSAYITDNESGWLCGTGCLRVRFHSADVLPKFCAYYLSTDEIKSWVSGHAVGSTMPNLNSSTLQRLPLRLPSLHEQAAVTKVLQGLDDKINLLQRQNKTLEAMAETLYRQWFLEGAEEGWTEFCVRDFADHIKHGVEPRDQPSTEFLHYSLPAFDAGQRPELAFGSQILSNKFKVCDGALLVSKLNPRVSRIWPVDKLPKDANAICSTEFQVLKPKKLAWFGYLYGLLTSNEARDALTMAASGTSGSHQRVRPEDILAIKTSLPNVERAEEFSRWVEPVLSKRQRNMEQMAALERLRNDLLPKLMSGEVRVSY